MDLFFVSNVYLLINSVFSVCYIDFFPFFPGGEIVETVIFTIGTYWFDIASIIKSLMIQIKYRR